MPVTCRDVVARSLRRLGIVAAGEEVAGVDEVVGIEALQEIIDGMRSGLFGRLADVLATSNLTANVFDRVIGNEVAGITVTLPTTYEEDAIRNGSVIEVRDLFTTVYLNYRWNGDTQRWAALTALTPSTDLPVGDNFVGAIVALLATRLAGEFGVPVTMEIMRDAASGARAIARSKDRRQDWDDQDILN